MLSDMKKLATALATVAALSLAAPSFACPNMDHDEAPAAPRTADKDKKAPDTTTTAKAKDAKPADAPKAKDTKPADAKAADKAKDGKPATKPGDKVSMN